MDVIDEKVTCVCVLHIRNKHLILHSTPTALSSLAFTRSDDCWQVTREAFPESAADLPSSRIKPISRGSYDRLEEFYAPVRTDCWPRD